MVVLLYALTSAVLIALVVKVEDLPLIAGLLSFAASFLSLFLLLAIIQLSDRTSIISLRRAIALFLISTVAWLFVFAIGIAFSILINNPSAKINTLLFGGLLAVSFELIVINGVFIKSTPQSLGLSIIHPLSLLGIILPRTAIGDIDSLVVAFAAGIVMLLSAIVYLRRLDKFSAGHGITSLQLLQAFMKTWVTKYPRDLEGFFDVYSKKETVKTKIFHFLAHDGKKITLFLPGIHAGPFYPVGSYNLSEAIYHELSKEGSTIPMVLHGVGGHERNLPKSEYTKLYASELRKFTESLIPDKSGGLKGPVRRKFGNTTVTTIALNNQVLAMVSKAPYNSDDLDPKMISKAMVAASGHDMDLALVDAHNSIGGENASPEEISENDWAALLDMLKSHENKDFQIGYAHSSEINFPHNSDISEAGIGVLLFQADTSKKCALVAVDANNARVGLREKLSVQLAKQGMELIELCTSDTHNLAARSLVNRGYFALGEATPTDQVIKGMMELVHIAQQRLAECKYSLADFSIDMPLTGVESLNDFASLTSDVLRFTRSYLKKIVVPLTIIMLAITLFY